MFPCFLVKADSKEVTWTWGPDGTVTFCLSSRGLHIREPEPSPGLRPCLCWGQCSIALKSTQSGARPLHLERGSRTPY